MMGAEGTIAVGFPRVLSQFASIPCPLFDLSAYVGRVEDVDGFVQHGG